MSGPEAKYVKAGEPKARGAYGALRLPNEIGRAVRKLAATGETTTIELSSISHDSSYRAPQTGTLGMGEVQAAIDANGPSNIGLTAYSGIWLAGEFGSRNEEPAIHIEFTRLPAFLAVPEVDPGDCLPQRHTG